MDLFGWKRVEDRLEKEFRFKEFVDALAFVNKIAPIAEEMNHHPDIILSYGKVIVRLTTHDAGKITEKDYALAEKIEEFQ